MSTVGTYKDIQIKNLFLDDQNPRFGHELLFTDEEGLLVQLELGFKTIEIAESIANTGYFQSEPLIVLELEQGRYIVLEGNRRLAALKSLTDASIRAKYAEAGGARNWDELAVKANLQSTSEVPCTVVKSRTESVAIIGFRHITGNLGWEPFAQGCYIESLVDRSLMNFAEIAKATGKKESEVKKMYYDVRIVNQLRKSNYDVKKIEGAYSLLTLVTGNPHLRAFGGLSNSSQVKVGSDPVDANRVEQFKELMTWVYGSSDKPAVISDSRQISKLANIVKETEGIRMLRDGCDLDSIDKSLFSTEVKVSDDEKFANYVRTINRGRAELSNWKVSIEVRKQYRDIIEQVCNELSSFVSE